MGPPVDAATALDSQRDTTEEESNRRSFTLRARECEECHTVDHGTGAMDEDSEGCISTKDYAYDQSNPLHHGYLQDGGNGFAEQDEDDSDDYNVGANGDHDKRQSIILPQDYLINQLAVALYDFEPENDNELGLTEGDIVYISYRHGQGWLVAENQEGTKTGLVPEEFVSYLEDSDEAADENGEEAEKESVEAARPFYLTHYITQGLNPAAGPRREVEEAEEDGGFREEEVSNKHSNSSQSDSDHWEDIDNLRERIADKLDIQDQ